MLSVLLEAADVEVRDMFQALGLSFSMVTHGHNYFAWQ